MIHRVRGRLVSVDETRALLDAGALTYELLVPGAAVAELSAAVGSDVQLETLAYLEGNPTASHFTPRLLGFVRAADRAFFGLLTRVKGVSMRKALRMMSVPTAQIAAAIERGDERLLTSLPEVGKKTAQQIIAELRGKARDYAAESEAPAAAGGTVVLSEAQRLAADVLVAWGDRRADAERWVAAVAESGGTDTAVDEIVRAAYRVKQGLRG